MSFKFHCTHCGQKLEAEEGYEGKQVSCPSCSNTFVVPCSSDTADSSPPPLEIRVWHFESDGLPQEPVPEHQIKNLISSGKITRTTRVWTKGMSSWINAENTGLSSYFNQASKPELKYANDLLKEVINQANNTLITLIKIISDFRRKKVSKENMLRLPTSFKFRILGFAAIIVILIVLFTGSANNHVITVQNEVAVLCEKTFSGHPEDIKESFVSLADGINIIKKTDEFTRCPEDYKNAYYKLQTSVDLLKQSINSVPTDAVGTIGTAFVNAMKGEWDGGAARMEAELKQRSEGLDTAIRELARVGSKYGAK